MEQARRELASRGRCPSRRRSSRSRPASRCRGQVGEQADRRSRPTISSADGGGEREAGRHRRDPSAPATRSAARSTRPRARSRRPPRPWRPSRARSGRTRARSGGRRRARRRRSRMIGMARWRGVIRPPGGFSRSPMGETRAMSMPIRHARTARPSDAVRAGRVRAARPRPGERGRRPRARPRQRSRARWARRFGDRSPILAFGLLDAERLPRARGARDRPGLPARRRPRSRSTRSGTPTRPSPTGSPRNRSASLDDASYVGSSIGDIPFIPGARDPRRRSAPRSCAAGASRRSSSARSSSRSRPTASTSLIVHRERPDVPRLDHLPVNQSYPVGARGRVGRRLRRARAADLRSRCASAACDRAAVDARDRAAARSSRSRACIAACTTRSTRAPAS